MFNYYSFEFNIDFVDTYEGDYPLDEDEFITKIYTVLYLLYI